MVHGILRLLVGARSLGLRCWSKVWVQVLHGERHAELEGGRSPLLELARQLCEAGFVDALSKCDAAVWEAAKEALTASQQAEIEEKLRVVIEQPTAQLVKSSRRCKQ